MHRSRAAIGGLAFFMCASVHAGSFQVKPVRVTLSADQPVAALTVRNLDATETVLQLQLHSWSQSDGEDVLERTEDLLATPPIVRIPGGGEQIVRVGLRRAPDATRELSYRMLLREVPPPPAKGFQGLQVALQVSLPVFVLPQAPLREDVQWHLVRIDAETLALRAHNAGTRHLQLLGATLEPRGGAPIKRRDLTGYVLPGETITWTIDAPAPRGGTPVVLVAQTDAGPVNTTLVLQGR